MLSALGALPEYQKALGYGCTVTFELWDGPPPEHSSGPPLNGIAEYGNFVERRKVLRILHNPCPFYQECAPGAPVTSEEVHPEHEYVLLELSEEQVRLKIEEIQQSFVSQHASCKQTRKNEEK